MRIFTDEHKQKLREHQHNKGKHLSDEVRRKISEAKKGKKFTEEHKKKLKDLIPWNKGLRVIYTKEAKEKMRLSGLKNWKNNFNNFKGKESPYWKGDNASYVTQHKWVYDNKGRPKVCEHCGITCEEKKLNWANIDHEYRRNVDDYISLCIFCHRKHDKKNDNKINKFYGRNTKIWKQ